MTFVEKISTVAFSLKKLSKKLSLGGSHASVTKGKGSSQKETQFYVSGRCMTRCMSRRFWLESCCGESFEILKVVCRVATG